MSDHPQIYVGIDVSKAQLDVAIHPQGECWQLSNDENGSAELAKRLTAEPDSFTPWFKMEWEAITRALEETGGDTQRLAALTG